MKSLECYVVHVGCICSGLIFIFTGLRDNIPIGADIINFPVTCWGVEIGKAALFALGALCLGIQNIMLEMQIRMFKKYVHVIPFTISRKQK